MNGNILTKDQSEQERKLFTYKTAAASIVIAQFGNEFVINKNIYFCNTRGYRGNIEDLFEVITYWYEKKRKWRNRDLWKRFSNRMNGIYGKGFQTGWI